MPHTVLLVEPDVDVLGELAEGLRARGLDVLLADTIQTALQRLQTNKATCLLISDTLLFDPNVEAQLSAEPLISRLPRWVLINRPAIPSDDSSSLPRHDPEAIARRLFTFPIQSPPVATDHGDFRGDLQQVSASDLLQLLSMNRRTGSLSFITPTGQGEVRIENGAIVDAVFRRIEGTKALYRLLSETEGTFSFVSGTTHHPRRISEPTHLLLLEGLRQIDEVRRFLEQLAANEDALQSTPQSSGSKTSLTPLETAIRYSLEAPKTATALLDDLSFPDLDILSAVSVLIERGLVRRIPRGAIRVELADPEQLGVLSAIVRQLKRPGFPGNSRIVLFSSPPRLAAALHALSLIADSIALSDPAPAAPVCFRMATLRLSEGQELDIIGLPNNLSYSPLWPLTLPGSAAVVALGHDYPPTLEEVAGLSSVPLLDAETLLGQFDEGDPRQISALVCATLEAAIGR